MSGPEFDFVLRHGWGGAYIMPETNIARDWCSANLDEDGEFGWHCTIDDDGDYMVAHANAMDVAKAIHRAGLTFANAERVYS